jgi:competence protein ComEA
MKLDKKYYILIGIIVALIIGVFSITSIYQGKDTPSISLVDEETTSVLESINTFYVDIKGSVNKPGVYKVDDQMIVNDLIKLAGGLTKNAYTKNINLATKLKEGMVVYVYSKNELTNTTSTTTILNDAYYSYEPTTTSSEVKVSGKVNINTATKEELMTVTGIGESKAIAIIDYRKNNKFNSIEDIMNVSGIGESLFAKIKEYITV